MYIYPNTNLRILTNVNLNSDYDHTIYFDGKVAQTEYFLAKTKFNLTNQSYQRKERGWIQVDINQNSLWDCTYLMYQNTAYHNKWFYAFILSVDYVNDSVSKINFEIDVMQTWYFDYLLDKCFVEREHTLSDNLFEHTLPEDLEIGDTYINETDEPKTMWFNSSGIYVVATEPPSFAPAVNYIVHKNVVSGLYYFFYDIDVTSDIGSLRTLLDDYVTKGKEDAVVAIFQAPKFIGDPNVDYQDIRRYGGGYADKDYIFSYYNFNSIGDGEYTPKNKKLFCYPYNYLSVSDKEGQEKTYKWELFTTGHIGEFLVEGNAIGKISISMTPKYYRNILYDRDNSISYDNFPVCQWSGDSYQVWLAQNGPSMNMRVISDINNVAWAFAGIGGRPISPSTRYPEYTRGMRTFDAIHTTADSLIDVGNMIANVIEAKRIPDKAHGSFSSGVINIQNSSSGFEFKQMRIKTEYAKIIDEYFSRFGYKCSRIKTPNIKARRKWTYTKTIGCELNGNVPSDDLVKIKSVFDHGVTFWDIRYANVGDYGDFTNPTLS